MNRPVLPLSPDKIAHYATIAGPMNPEPLGRYKVRYRREPNARPVISYIMAAIVSFLQVAFFSWLVLDTSHYPALTDSLQMNIALWFMAGALFVLSFFQMVNVITLCCATVRARYPIPVPPEPGLRVAFLTTLVPGKEPLDIVERTLRQALDIDYDGTLHVWLLNEGTDDQLLAGQIDEMAERLGERFFMFSRLGMPEWNRPKGRFKTRTKHGNYNAWLDGHGSYYDVFVSVDPDHVPAADFFLERMLGYFRDPAVGFVVGPQVYCNNDNFVTRCAESQQFIFHTKVQPMGNASNCAMLVGTNNAVRISAIKSIGGFRDSITEDMATSLMFHSLGWKSVYTPDVLAYGLGPSSWTDYFTQQHRWSGGTFAALSGDFWRCFGGLGLKAKLHYLQILSYYPSAAIGWVLGAINCALYLAVGETGIKVAPQAWHMIFATLIVTQVALYDYNRRHNISPFEKKNSSGMAGMLISVLTAPVYTMSLVGMLLGRKKGFVVTPKGDSASLDRVRTFRPHLLWAVFLGGALVYSYYMDHINASMLAWVSILLAVCLLPVAIWLTQSIFRRDRTIAPVEESAYEITNYVLAEEEA